MNNRTPTFAPPCLGVMVNLMNPLSLLISAVSTSNTTNNNKGNSAQATFLVAELWVKGHEPCKLRPAANSDSPQGWHQQTRHQQACFPHTCVGSGCHPT